MDGENNGQETQETGASSEPKNAQTQAGAQEHALKQDSGTEGGVAPADSEGGTESEVAHDARVAFEQKLKERDEEIASLKAQVAEAAKSAEKESELNARIAELEEKAEDARTDYELTLAGCRSTRAGRVLLEEHDGDVEALKAAEPWLFEDKVTVAGVTGLPNAGAATNDDAALAHWREIAGLDSDN